MKYQTGLVLRGINIKAPIETLYACWTTRVKLEQWFLERADFFEGERRRESDEAFQKGDRFEWKWNNWPPAEAGEILEANGKDRVAFTFGGAGNVLVALNPNGDQTEVVLTQEGLSTSEEEKMNFHVGCSNGWTFWMTNLKAWLEHGVTLNATGLSQDETKHLVNS